ncbi:MAG: ABC transporter permease [Pseudomonadota bacterium]
MMRLVLKDLREILAAPLSFLAVIAWACAVLWLTALLPLPTPKIDVALMAPAACERAEADLPCPTPDVETLEHAIADLPNTDYHGRRDPAADVFSRLHGDDLDLILVWHPTVASAESLLGPPDWADFDDVETAGLWIAYARPRTQAAAAQIRFAARQIQSTGLHIVNARRAGEDPVLPSTGLADLFGEFAPVVVAARQQARLDEEWEAEDRRNEAVLARFDELAAGYESQFGEALSEDEARRLRDAFFRQYRAWETATTLLFAQALEERFNEAEAEGSPVYGQEAAVYFAQALEAARSDDAADERPLLTTPFLVMAQDGPARTRSAWLIPGLILIIAAAISFTFTAASTVREREQGTEHLLFVAGASQSINPLLLKPVSPALLALVSALSLLLFAQALLGFQIKPGLGAAIGLLLVVILTAAFQGLVAGCLARNQSTASAISAAYLVMLLLFGNVFIPLQSTGWLAASAANLLPVAAGAQAWDDWMTWGAPVKRAAFAGPLAIGLLSFAAALAAAALRRRRA